MRATVKKWGNSLGVHILAQLADQLQLNNNSIINIELIGKSIIITKPKRPKYTLKYLLDGLE